MHTIVSYNWLRVILACHSMQSRTKTNKNVGCQVRNESYNGEPCLDLISSPQQHNQLIAWRARWGSSHGQGKKEEEEEEKESS